MHDLKKCALIRYVKDNLSSVGTPKAIRDLCQYSLVCVVPRLQEVSEKSRTPSRKT